MADKPRHGIYLWTAKGELPQVRGRVKIQQALQAFQDGVIEELGGPGAVTPQQAVLIETTVRMYGAILLCDLYVAKEGVFRKDKAKDGVLEFQPVLSQSFLAFTNTIRLNLGVLFPGGLGAKVKQAVSLRDILEEGSSAKKDKRGGKG